MDKIEWRQFSDAESDAIAVQALKAAHKCIKRAAAYDGDTVVATRDILSAFSAANAVIRDATRVANEGAAPGTKYHSPYIEVHHVVATAVYFAILGDGLEDVYPDSIAGAVLLSFAHACKALDAQSEAENALQGDYLFGAHHADDVLKLLASTDHPQAQQ
jgi:hypothetical protein